ncbi:hypothetical protein SBDP1_750027 [Syntrophobacter sp. SbD1]|nr:hypothetical protein SBDP1_750027 [Syntrophobacter sp. SbD1]
MQSLERIALGIFFCPKMHPAEHLSVIGFIEPFYCPGLIGPGASTRKGDLR